MKSHSLYERKFTGIKEKGVSGLSKKAYLEKSSKDIYSMHASKPTSVLLSRVIVLEFLGFQEPLYD